MSVAFDAFSFNDLGTSDPREHTHSPVGTPRAIIVATARVNGTDQVESVTYGGDSLTEVTLSPLDKTTGELSSISIWHRGSSILTGDQTVSVDTAGFAHIVWCVSLTAATDTEVQNTATRLSDSEQDPEENLALSGVECWVGLAFHWGGSTLSSVAAQTGWTQQDEVDFGPDVGGFYTFDTVGTSDVTLTINTSSADDVALFGVAIREAAAVDVLQAQAWM